METITSGMRHANVCLRVAFAMGSQHPRCTAGARAAARDVATTSFGGGDDTIGNPHRAQIVQLEFFGRQYSPPSYSCA